MIAATFSAARWQGVAFTMFGLVFCQPLFDVLVARL